MHHIYRTIAFLIFCHTASLQAADYFVSPSGNDANAGTQSQPFRTINHATTLLQPGDTCYLREGVYRESMLLTTSGQAGAPIRFTAWPGELVTLSGADPVETDWSVHAGNIFKTNISREVSQVLVDGKMMVEARWPNRAVDDLLNKSTWRPNAEGSVYGTMADPVLASAGIDFTGAIAVLNVGGWQTFSRLVENHAPGKSSFNYAMDMGNRMSLQTSKRETPATDYYFIFGKLEALDTPGEWFYDRGAGTLYLYPPDGQHPSNITVETKSREYAFRADGIDYIQLYGLHFYATTFCSENSDYWLIENCRLQYPTYADPMLKQDGSIPYVPEVARDGNALFLGGVRTLSPTLMAGKNNIIRKCQVTYSEAPGILVNGSDNTVENCWFSEIDWRGLGQGANTWTNAGVHMGQSATSTFRRNTVYNVGASAGVVLPGMGPSICEWNHLYNVGYVQSDGAMIQCNGINLNHTIIRYNWVHDHYAWYYGKTGIRADDLARNLIVHHNVVWNCGEKGIAMKGDRHQVHHNTCINNTWLDIVLWMAEEPFKEWAPNQHDFLIDQQNENSVAYNNLAPVLTGQMPYEIRNADSLLLPVAEMSHNRYAGPEILLGTSPLTFADDETLLANPAAQDFRPSENSPLIDAGRVVEGITGTYVGEAPDIGAYEYGGEYWIPGADWNPDSVFSIITEIDDVRDATTPNTYTLYPNYPNPFNPATNIRFKVPNSIQVQMDIFDISGRKVLTLLDKEVESGDHSVRWNGTNRHHLRVASGVYLVRMTAGPYISVQKMLLLN